MRIDHTLAQPLVPHHVPNHASAGEFPRAGQHAIPKDISYRLLQAETEEPVSMDREMRIGSKVDGFERKGQAWFVATELQSDLLVEVGDMSFHLHKFPLLSRSGKLNRLVFDSRDTENGHIKLVEMPGGPETFELAAKFCYGVAVELTSANVAALRCAAEYLEMTEDLDEGNLVSKTEAFLSFVVLASWKDSVTVLHGCEKLLPWADRLHIVRRCCESIAWKACTDPRGIRWSFTERTELRKSSHPSPAWGPKSRASSRISDQVPSDWWLEDICVVCVSFFTKIIQAIKVKGMKYDLLGSAIVHYALKWLPGLTRESVVVGGKDTSEPSIDGSFLSFGGHPPHPTGLKDNDTHTNDLGTAEVKNRELIETLAGILPTQKDAVPCTFLLRLLRLGKMAHVNPDVITDLEKRAGLQLDQGTLSDLLIPCFDHSCETLFDIDLVQRMLDNFLLQEFISSPGTLSDPEKTIANSAVENGQGTAHSTSPAKMRVAKLIDNYLAEVGRDQNFTLHKFLALAEALPEHTRVTDDGLYKAIDTYLKAHPVLSESDRKKLCRTLDCQRLSLDACMHAAQNERLPLRVVVQVLFGEQIKLRNAVTGTSSFPKDHAGPYPEDDQISTGGSSSSSSSPDSSSVHGHDTEHSEEEIKVLRSDVERMKGKFMALQHDYTAIQQQLEKLTKHPKNHLGSTGWKKLLPHPHLTHPHFHVPHFITHPMDLFHPKDHHHHDGHNHHAKDHHQHEKGHDGHHHHHAKPEHDGSPHGRQHHHFDKEQDLHGSKDHDSSVHHHHSKKHDSLNGGHQLKDHHDFHREKDHHHHSKEHHHSREHDSHHRHSKEHDSHHHPKDHDSLHRHHKDHDSHHHRHKDHDSHHHSKDAHRSHHSKDSHDSHHHLPARDSIYHLSHSKHADQLSSSHSHHSENHDHHPSKDHHSHHDHHHSKDHHTHHSKDVSHHVPNAGHHGLPPHPAEPRRSKERESHHSTSHPESSQDSSKSLEGPATPTHSSEHHKKHASPFANAIRKWRNSIS